MISIIFPHALNPENNRILELNKRMLKDNTSCEYELLILENNHRPDLVYEFWDWGIQHAKYDLILWHNTDIVMAPGWDINVLKHQDDGDWLGIELVECGAIGVHPNNIHKDFGRTYETFERSRFEIWARDYAKRRPSYRKGFCWYSPSVWRKDWYIRMGGFNTYPHFPHPNDSIFREQVEKKGARFIVVNSYGYHFQRARENNEEKAER